MPRKWPGRLRGVIEEKGMFKPRKHSKQVLASDDITPVTERILCSGCFDMFNMLPEPHLMLCDESSPSSWAFAISAL
eukprot:4983717-Amphidinium_carterae.1